jgi:hypothetical protein
MAQDRNWLEWVRTCERLDRRRPPSSTYEADPDARQRHLLDLGYAVTLYDLVPLHIQQTAVFPPTHHRSRSVARIATADLGRTPIVIGVDWDTGKILRPPTFKTLARPP